MSKLNKITPDNIKNFIEGTYKYYMNKIVEAPTHLKEQHLYRLYICKDTCFKNNTCVNCGCPQNQRIFAASSCGNSDIPDLMAGSEWRAFKEDNNIDISKIELEMKSYE